MTTPAAPPDLPDDDDVLGRTSEEYRRLRWQARLWEPTTARVLDQVGIGPGMRCLPRWQMIVAIGSLRREDRPSYVAKRRSRCRCT